MNEFIQHLCVIANFLNPSLPADMEVYIAVGESKKSVAFYSEQEQDYYKVRFNYSDYKRVYNFLCPDKLMQPKDKNSILAAKKPYPSPSITFGYK